MNPCLALEKCRSRSPRGSKSRPTAGRVRVKGPKGELVERDPGRADRRRSPTDEVAHRPRAATSRTPRACHGLLRSLVANAVEGVTKGFTQELEISGVGYKAEVKGKSVVFSLGYSHPIDFPIPEGIAIARRREGGQA